MTRALGAYLSFIAAVIVVGLASWQGWPWYVAAIGLIGFACYGFMTLYEHFAADPKYVACIATMAAIASVFRAAMQGIPDVQPATFVVILSGYCFGPLTGTAVGAFTALGSNLFLGEGAWTPWQTLAWGLVGATAGWFRFVVPTFKVSVLVPFGFAWGFGFGWIMNTWSLIGSGAPSFLVYLSLCAQSFPFDLAHALATSVFLLVGGVPVYHILERFRKRMSITRHSAEHVLQQNQ